jgi:FkbM family methyltransferase
MTDASVEQDLIYDVGLHKGEDSEFYLRKGFRVIAVEALPSNAQIAADRLRTYVDCGQLIILNVAVAERDGPLTFFESLDCSTWGTSNPELERSGERSGHRWLKRTVEGVNFSKILARYGMPYFLKIDIQGEDTLCLKALRDFAARPRYLSYESESKSITELRRELAVLRDLGYSRFKVVRQDDVCGQRCPFPAKEGQYVDQRFEESSSGLFGEETPGDWVDEDRVIRRYRRMRFQRYLIRVLSLLHLRGLVPEPGWHDIHAKQDGM